MTSLLVNMARLNLRRSLWHKLCSKYTDQECYDAFVASMNVQAKKWGLTNTKWINPSGLGEIGAYSQSTANDLAVMILHAFAIGGGITHSPEGYELTIKKPYLIPGHRFKKKMVYSTTTIETIGDDYPIIGAKTGSGDGYQTLVMVCDIKGIKVAGAIMNADDEQSRFDAMDELMRIGYKILHEHEVTKNMRVTKARNASLCIMDKDGEINHIFTQNADEVSAPMSTTKVMTLTIARKYIKDWQKMEYIIPFDTKNTKNDIFYDWEQLTIEDMMQAMMRHSSNVAANAIARIVGAMILEHKQ